MKKIHTIPERIISIKNLKSSHMQMMKYAKDHSLESGKLHLLERCLKADDMRIELLEKKKFSNCFKLLRYMDCYHSRKSWLVEPYMALTCKD